MTPPPAEFNARFDFLASPEELARIDTPSLNLLLSASLRASHTFKLYGRIFASLDNDALFLPFETASEDESRLANLFNVFRRTPSFFSIMVSDPFKQRVAPYLDQITERAQLCGGVNLIQKEGTLLIGDNLDGIALTTGLAQMDQVNLDGESVLFFGCGGVSSAVAVALAGRLSAVGLIDKDAKKAARL